MIILTISVLAQDIICHKCKKAIHTSYMIVDGLTFHDEHFQCNECGKPIIANFYKKDGKYYHQDCFLKIEGKICDVCKKLITDETIFFEGRNYHTKCYYANIVPKCVICLKQITNESIKTEGKIYHSECFYNKAAAKCAFCSKPILDAAIIDKDKRYHEKCYAEYFAAKCVICMKPILAESFTDINGNSYHSFHNKDYKTCDNCSVIICEKTTGGGRKYDDGRNICNKCYNKAVFNNDAINKLFLSVRNKLRSFGITISENITVEGLNRNELKKNYAKKYSEDLKGFCKTATEMGIGGSNLNKKKYSHKIYVLNGVPEIYIAATLAYEMMHAWISENTDNGTNSELEGFCNFSSYLYLRDLNNPDAKLLLNLFSKDKDPIYGEEYRIVHSKFAYKPVSDFLKYVKYACRK